MTQRLCYEGLSSSKYLQVKRRFGVVGVRVGYVGSVDECEEVHGCCLGKILAHVDEMVYKAWAFRDKMGPVVHE